MSCTARVNFSLCLEGYSELESPVSLLKPAPALLYFSLKLLSVVLNINCYYSNFALDAKTTCVELEHTGSPEERGDRLH